jgi:hypothetical protein
MQTYKLSPASIRRSTRNLALWLGLGTTAVLLSTFWHIYSQGPHGNGPEPNGDSSIALMIFGSMLIAPAFMVCSKILKYGAELRSYRITLDAVSITRWQKKLDEVQIPLDQIQSIHHSPESGIWVRGSSASPLWIPSSLERSAELLDALSQYAPVQPLDTTWQNYAKKLVPAIGLIVGFVLLMRTPNLPVTIVGTVAYGGLALGMGVATWRNPVPTRLAKLQILGVFLLACGLLAWKLWLLLADPLK